MQRSECSVRRTAAKTKPKRARITRKWCKVRVGRGRHTGHDEAVGVRARTESERDGGDGGAARVACDPAKERARCAADFLREHSSSRRAQMRWHCDR